MSQVAAYSSTSLDNAVRQSGDSDVHLSLLRNDPRAGLCLLFDQYYDSIYRYCRHRLYHADAAEDATAETFLKVARHYHAFRGQQDAALRAWLFRIAGNEVVAYRRAQTRRRNLHERLRRDLQTAAQDNRSEFPSWPELFSAMQKLPNADQELLTMRFLEQTPYEQIAQVVESTPAALRVRVHRILKRLRRRLEKMQYQNGS